MGSDVWADGRPRVDLSREVEVLRVGVGDRANPAAPLVAGVFGHEQAAAAALITLALRLRSYVDCRGGGGSRDFGIANTCRRRDWADV